MKYLVVIMLSVASLFGSSFGCNKDHSAVAGNTNTYNEGSNTTDNTKGNKMKIKIGSNTFNATLFDNATATALKEMLPLTLNMDELDQVSANSRCSRWRWHDGEFLPHLRRVPRGP